MATAAKMLSFITIPNTTCTLFWSDITLFNWPIND